MAESSASVLARHADSVRSGGASDGIEVEPGRPSPPRLEANPAAAGRAAGKQPRKQRRLPREMRGLLAGEAGVASSDSEDEEVRHRVKKSRESGDLSDEEANKKKDTKHVFVKILTWRFRALTIGKWPDKDWDDKPFPKDSPGDMKKCMWLADGPFSEHT